MGEARTGRAWRGVLSLACAVAASAALGSGSARAGDLRNEGKLLLTDGVSSVEGAAGGGLASWAVIAGGETEDGVGVRVHGTRVSTSNFDLTSGGVSVGVFNRVEISYARQAFDTGRAGGALGLGRGFTFDQDVVGAKVRLFGDLVYDQDRWTPQVAIGAQYKSNDEPAIVRAVGARRDTGVDVYVAASKLFLAQSLLLSGTVRATQANQFGILGFGGDRHDGYSAQFEGSAAWLVTRRLVVGAEYRTKPDNLRFAREDDAYDIFGAYAFTKNLSLTLAYVDLGSIATFDSQRGAYLSLQAGF